MLGIYAGLMGPDLAEYTEGQQGSACTFLFTQSTTLCVHTVMDGQLLQRGFPAFCSVHAGKGSRSSTPTQDSNKNVRVNTLVKVMKNVAMEYSSFFLYFLYIYHTNWTIIIHLFFPFIKFI